MCQFERALRRGFTEQEMASLLRILMVWRSATDTLRAVAEDILRIICPYFYESFQRFVKDQLEDILRKLKPAVTRVQKLFAPMREVFGDWLPGEERIRKGKHLPAHPHKQLIAAPSPAAIEFVRIQLHDIIRATSKAHFASHSLTTSGRTSSGSGSPTLPSERNSLTSAASSRTSLTSPTSSSGRCSST
jgi:hypothetical protein